jgi:hypothetical protein
VYSSYQLLLVVATVLVEHDDLRQIEEEDDQACLQAPNQADEEEE